MASQVSNNPKQLFGGTSSVHHTTHATYDTLMRQSRKLGRTATQALGGASQGVRQIFGQQPRPATDMAESIAELKEAVAHSREVIATAKTVLPFLFPDEICLDRTKITITKRKFFWSLDVISIRIEDVLNISTSVGPVFGSITIASRVMSSVDHFEIHDFWRNDAIELKQIIQGYLIARQNGLETDHLTCAELVETLREFGRAGQ